MKTKFLIVSQREFQLIKKEVSAFINHFILYKAPDHIGPGYYFDQDKKGMEIFNPPKENKNLQFGKVERFNYRFEKSDEPGPGSYNEHNKWNKRTYNLKFLNLQANAYNNAIAHQRAQSFRKNAENIIMDK